MPDWTPFAYLYDGSYAGFLTCVHESYARRERPECFSTPEDPRVTLWPERAVETCRDKAGRVYRSLSRELSLEGQRLVTLGFLTALPERELRLYTLLRLGCRAGPAALRDLADERVFAVVRAVRGLQAEAHQFKGFLRFSDQGGLLCGEIAPKNRVLPLLRPHFCARYPGERFLIYDRTHREALCHRPGAWAVVPLEDFQTGPAGGEELDYRRLWRRFYDAVAIEERYNPKCRMSHMPKRYWSAMTEFQEDHAP